MSKNRVCHTNIDFTHMVVRYDNLDHYLAVTVAYATSLEEAQALWRAFVELAPTFAPTALYAIRYYAEVDLYQKPQ
jgi:hypothetical protein